MSQLEVVGLYTHPVKSWRACDLQMARVTSRGFEHDRRFMLVDPDGALITQRKCPELATCGARVVEGADRCLRIELDSRIVSEKIPDVFSWEDGERIVVKVWRDIVEVVVQADGVNAALSRALNRPVRLVYAPDSSERLSDGQIPGAEPALNSLSDGFPFLLTTVESLADLSGKIGGDHGITMDRFRPNIVVRGCSQAFEEETWRVFRIGGVTFYGMKRCGRCIITTTDQDTGQRMGGEPLRTLAGYRRFGNDVCFGMNLNHAGDGVISLGDSVQVLECGEPFIVNDKMAI